MKISKHRPGGRMHSTTRNAKSREKIMRRKQGQADRHAAREAAALEAAAALGCMTDEERAKKNEDALARRKLAQILKSPEQVDRAMLERELAKNEAVLMPVPEEGTMTPVCPDCSKDIDEDLGVPCRSCERLARYGKAEGVAMPLEALTYVPPLETGADSAKTQDGEAAMDGDSGETGEVQ